MKKKIVFLSLLFFGATFSHAETTGQSGGAYQYYLKALLLESQGNFSAAHEEIEKALSVAPQSAYLYRTAAELSLRLGQVVKAADEIERAVDLNGKDVRSLIISGQIAWALGDSDKSIARLKSALSIDPDESQALISLAGALTPKDPKAAVKLYKDFLVRHPNEADIQERLAQIYQATNEWDKAQSTWSEVLANSPNSIRAHLALAQIAEINFDTSTAVGHYESVLTQDPNNLPLLLRVGELRYRNDEMGKAAESFSKAQAVEPSSPGANFWLALLAENKGDWPDAIRHIKNIPYGDREPGVMLRLSYYHAQASQSQDAIDVLKKLSDSNPSNVDFLNYLAAGYEEAHQSQNAEKVLLRVIDLDPNDADAYFRLGTLYDRSGRFPKAVDAMRTAIRLKPDFHMALNYLGYTFADKNMNLEEAEELVMEAVALSPHNPAYLDSLGWVYFHQGKLQKAQDFLKEAVARVQDATIFDHMGDVMMASNNSFEAIFAWDESLRVDPKSKKVRAKLAKALKGLSPFEKLNVFVKRNELGFGAVESVHGLVQVTACENSPCARSKAQITYEKNDVLNVEIPGPLVGPVMQAFKKHGSPATYGALHPQFQKFEFYVTRAFDRFEPLLSGEFFKKLDLVELGKDVREKAGLLTCKSKTIELSFDSKSGVLKSLLWDDGEALEKILMGKYQFPLTSEFPKSIEWQYNRPAFKLQLEFINPAVTSVPSIKEEPLHP